MRACDRRAGAPPLPEQRLTNADLEQRVDTSDQWIVERTGIRERRVAGDRRDDRQPRHRGGRRRDQARRPHARRHRPPHRRHRDAEQPIPHTGAFVGDGLGIRCGSFDLNAGCAGFVYELVVGSSMLTAGNLDHVLVIGAETLSRVIDPTDRGTCILFGDGAAAIVLSAVARRRPGLLAWDLGCDGSATGLLEIPAGGSRLPTTRRDGRRTASTTSRWPGQEVFRRAVRIVVESATTALERAGVDRRRRRLVRAPPGQHPHHRGRRQPARDPGGAHAREHRPLRQHVARRRSRSSSPKRPTTDASATATSCCCPASAPA